MGTRDNPGSNPLTPHLQRRRQSDDQDASVTKGDLYFLSDSLTKAMNDGFKGVHERQDKTNGRVNTAHEMLAEQKTKISNLEREVFARAGRRLEDPAAGQTTDEAKDRRVTERDVRMFVAGGIALSGSVIFIWKVLPFLLSALKP